MSEIMSYETSINLAADEAYLIWHDPGAEAAREEYLRMDGETPISGFMVALTDYLQKKYGLSRGNADWVSREGLEGAPPEVTERARKILKAMETD